MLASLLLALAPGPAAPVATAPASPSPFALTVCAVPWSHGGGFPPPPPTAGGGPPPPPPSGGGGGGGAPVTPGSGGGGGGGGAAPTTPGPVGPAPPGIRPPAPESPTSPGPSAPGAPGAGPATPAPAGPSAPTGLRPVTSAPNTTTVGRLDWSHWWNLERDHYLRVRGQLDDRSAEQGRTALLQTPGIAPDRRTIEALAIPGLMDILADERSDDLVTAALISLARIGIDAKPSASDEGSIDPKSPVDRSGARMARILSLKLAARSQEVSETAALALGILGVDESLPFLVELIRGTEAGARSLRRGAVPDRTRAFAAFGLGLMADGTEDPDTRQRIALELVRALEEEHTSLELPVAATIALGLSPAPDRLTVPAKDIREDRWVDAVLSRNRQVRYLLDRVAPAIGKPEALPPVVRAHSYCALASLGAAADPDLRKAVIGTLMERALDRQETISGRGAAAIALGRIVNAGDAGIDPSARKLLEQLVGRGQAEVKRHATIALARAGSRPGPGDSGLAGSDAARRFIERALGRTRSHEQPWHALALGVFGYRMADVDEAAANRAMRPIADLLGKQRNAATIGAYAIGLGLASRDRDASKAHRAALRSAFQRVKDPRARGHMALALGMMNDRQAAPLLRKALDEATFQPQLLWSAAVGLGLMGDAELTDILVDALLKARSNSSRAAAAAALGQIGDRRAIRILCDVMGEKAHPSETRAFAAVGLGMLCEDRETPWRTPVAHALPYSALTSTLSGNARGVLDIL